MGCMERYAAKDMESRKVMLAPWLALAIAVRMNRLLRADVERAIHVTNVNGLNRKLPQLISWGHVWLFAPESHTLRQ